MNIGVDVDGVILDSERVFDFYADYMAFFEFGKEKVRNDSLFIEQRYDNLSESEVSLFFDRYFDKVTQECAFMPGAAEILKKLKSEGHKLFVITQRGYYNQNEILYASGRLKELGIDFDGIEWGCKSKLAACEKNKIDVMIEDNPAHIEVILQGGTKCIQLFSENIEPIKHKDVFFAGNFVDVYKIIKSLEK